MVTNNSTNNYACANFIVSATAGSGNYTTIASALAAASSGATIFVKPGTYTENPTLKAGVNLNAFTGDGYSGNVIIKGKCTATFAGSCTISGIELQTNSDYALSITGSNATIVNLIDCNVNGTNNTAINNASASSSVVNLYNCIGDLGTTGIGFFASSSTGGIFIDSSRITNTGNSSTASTWSNGVLLIYYSEIQFVVASSGTIPNGNIIHTFFNVGAMNTPALTHNSTSATPMSTSYSFFGGGSASAVSIGAGATLDMYFCEVSSSNTNAITGGGTLKYEALIFTGTSSTINTSTQNPIPWPVQQGGTGLTASGTTGNVLTSNGTIWTSAAPATSGTVTSVSGTANQVSVATGTTTPVISLVGPYTPATYTAHGVLIGEGTSSIAALGAASTGTVLSGVTSADPAFTAFPQVSGLGIGASPGSTAGLTFDGSNFMSTYTTGTFTPTLLGASTAGTTTYSTQVGYYTQIGNIMHVAIEIVISAATGTGNATIGALPATVKNQASYAPIGTVNVNSTTWTWPSLTTTPVLRFNSNTATAVITFTGSTVGSSNLQMNNSALTLIASGFYQV